MFNIGNKSHPKIFTMTPEHARNVIRKSIEDSASMIAIAETILGEAATTPKQKKRIDQYIKEERNGITLRHECFDLVGMDSVACSVDDLVEFNTSFPRNRPGIDAREAFQKALATDDED